MSQRALRPSMPSRLSRSTTWSVGAATIARAFSSSSAGVYAEYAWNTGTGRQRSEYAHGSVASHGSTPTG